MTRAWPGFGRDDHRVFGSSTLAMLLEKAVVLVNSVIMTEAQQRQCLFAGTLASSGLPQPLGVFLEPVNPTSEEWKRAVEINLLGLFVLYALDSKAAAGTRKEIDQAIGALIDEMHVSEP